MSSILSQINFKPLKRYLLAIVTTAVAISLTAVITPLRERHSLGLVLLTVVLTAWLMGTGPSLLVIFLGILAWNYFIVEPLYSFKIDLWSDGPSLFVFLLIALLISYLQSLRRRVERALVRAEQHQALVLQVMSVGVWDFNMLTGEFWWSPELKRIFGCADQDVPTNYAGFLGFIHPDDRTQAVDAMTCGVEKSIEYQIRVRIIRMDNQVRWVTMRGRSFQNADGRTERIVGATLDVSHSNPQLSANAEATAGSV